MLRTAKFQKFNPASLKQRIFKFIVVATITFAVLALLNASVIANSLHQLIQLIPWDSLGGAFFIFGLRLTDVPIGTLKTVLMVRGMRTWATLLGLIEVTIWLMAMGKVMGQLDNPWNIAGYALGVVRLKMFEGNRYKSGY